MHVHVQQIIDKTGLQCSVSSDRCMSAHMNELLPCSEIPIRVPVPISSSVLYHCSTTAHYFSPQVVPDSGFQQPMRKREWTFAKFADELRKRMASNDSEAVYYQDALTDAAGEQIKHDFVHFNWQWLNERKKRYNWGQLTSNLLLIGQAGNITPCHFDEQHNFFNQVCE